MPRSLIIFSGSSQIRTSHRSCGHFEVPLAASLSHAQKGEWLRDEHKLPEALAEAQQAVALAPSAVRSNVLLADILTEMNRADEARPYYEKALASAKTIEPAFQVGWVEGLEKKLAGGKAGSK